MTQIHEIMKDAPNSEWNEEGYAVDFNQMLTMDLTKFMDTKPGGGGKSFTYLSWAWALIHMKREYPHARWWPHIFKEEGSERLYSTCPDGSAMVAVYVQLAPSQPPHFMQLPVLDDTNRAISEELLYWKGEEKKVEEAPWKNQKRKPNASDISNAIMRCMVKCIAAGSGIGLHIYAGEDIPPPPSIDKATVDGFKTLVDQRFGSAKDVDELKEFAKELDAEARRLAMIGWFQAQFIQTKAAIESEDALGKHEGGS